MSTTAAAAGPVLPAPDLGTVDGDGVTTAGLVVALDAVYVELGANVRTCELELGLVVAAGAVTDAGACDTTAPARPYALAQSSGLLPAGQQSVPFVGCEAQ